MSGVSTSRDIVARSRLQHVLPAVTGTNAIVSSTLPSGFVSLTDMLSFVFESVGANTGAMTLDIGDGVARPMRRSGGGVMVAGDIPAADYLIEAFYDLSGDYFHCQIHDKATATPLAAAAAGAVGISQRLAREDHVHPANMVDATPLVASGTGAVGTGIQAAREDHVHPINPEIATAQSTANTAITNAAAAQSTANTALSNAATAQLTSGTKQTLTGLNIDFTGIPSTAKRIVVAFSGVTLNGSAHPIVQIGSGSFVTTGYLSLSDTGAAALQFTNGFGIYHAGPTIISHGVLELVHIGGNTWVQSHVLGRTDAALAIRGGGSITLGGVLDRLRVTTSNSTDNYDGGSVNILYD